MQAQFISHIFDFDGNLVTLDTENILFEKDTGREIGITSEMLHRHFKDIGVRGIFKNFEIRQDRHTGTFRNFNYHPAINHLRLNLEAAIPLNSRFAKLSWQGLSFRRYQVATSTLEGARRTRWLTSRGMSPTGLFVADQVFQTQGWIRYLPPVQNHVGVTYQKPQADPSDASPEKARQLMKWLDQDQAETESLCAGCSGPQSFIDFSDDFLPNILGIEAILSQEAMNSRWPLLGIVLQFTPKTNENGPMFSSILLPGQRAIRIRGILTAETLRDGTCGTRLGGMTFFSPFDQPELPPKLIQP